MTKVEKIETPEDVRKLNWDAYEVARRITRAAEMLGLTKVVEDMRIILDALMVNESLRSFDDFRTATSMMNAMHKAYEQ